MIVGDAKLPLGELAHYGIKGMKWGVRTGGLSSRIKGALDDKNQRRTAFLTRARNKKGVGIEEKASRVAADIVNLGSKRTNKNIDKQLQSLGQQRKRIDGGKLKAWDILSTVGTVSASDLLVSRRDNKGAGDKKVSVKKESRKQEKDAVKAAKDAAFDRGIAAQNKVNNATTVAGYNRALDNLAAVQRKNKEILKSLK